MSPKLVTSKEVAVEEDMDERERTDAGGGLEPRESGDVKFGFGGDVAGGELSAGETAGAPVSGGRREGTQASERGWSVEPCAAPGLTRTRVGAGAREVRRERRPAVWADAGRRASGQRRRDHGAPRHVAPVDAGHGLVESRAQTIPASPAAGAQATFWRAGATRWQFPRMVRGAGPPRVLDDAGRRCDGADAGAAWGRGNDLGGGRRPASVDRALRGAAGALYRLEECLYAGADGGGAGHGDRAPDAVWSHVRVVGHSDHRGKFPAGEGTSRAQSRNPSGPPREETPAVGDRRRRRMPSWRRRICPSTTPAS